MSSADGRSYYDRIRRRGAGNGDGRVGGEANLPAPRNDRQDRARRRDHEGRQALRQVLGPDLEDMVEPTPEYVEEESYTEDYLEESPPAGEDEAERSEDREEDDFDHGEDDDHEVEELYTRGQGGRLGQLEEDVPRREPGEKRGKHGPRTSGSADDRDSRPASVARSHTSSRSSPQRAPSQRSEEMGSRHRPRGNLPPAPPFDGDRKKDAKCFKHWLSKVDSYIEIAKKIIDDSEIGLRLHAALEGEAAEYLEDIPARTFGVTNGWQVLIGVLKEKYDERRMHKIGAAMKGFFNMNTNEKQNMTLVEVADLMDKAARRCREADLVLPDEIMTYFFFQHTNANMERQANILLRTGGEYNWKKVKQAVELLYPSTTVPQRSREPYKQYGKGRSAHETTQGDWSHEAYVTENMDIEDWLYYEDPVEKIAEVETTEGIPDGLQHELHTVFATHRENRARLAKAVKARGFYVNKSKGKGKFSKGKGQSDKGKGKSKHGGGGKARGGMSLEELKKVTVCGDCQQTGHWKGDKECRGPKKAHETTVATPEEERYEENQEYEEEWQDWEQDEQASAWVAERDRSRATKADLWDLDRADEQPDQYKPLTTGEADDVVRGVNALKRKATGRPSSAPKPTTMQKSQDKSLPSSSSKPLNVFEATRFVQEQIAANRPRAIQHVATAPEAVAEAFNVFGVKPPADTSPTVWDCAKEDKDYDLEKMRSINAVVREGALLPGGDRAQVPEAEEFQLVRSVNANTRLAPTVKPGTAYITIDTACENTVGGLTWLHSVAKILDEKHQVKPIIHAEEESYRFGPGEPKISYQRWHVPIAVGGKPMVIKTSALEDRDPAMNRIPWLAGQDWLRLVEAVVDIGASKIFLKALGAEAELFVDHTGHLVVAVDDFPREGWPQGRHATRDDYAGVLWVTEKAYMGDTRVEKYTHIYNPEDDNYNNGGITTRTLCKVDADVWEYHMDFPSVYIRHHVRPRTNKFHPQDTVDGPQSKELQPLRITFKHGNNEPEFDTWDEDPEEAPWTGFTVLFGWDCDPNFKLSQLPQPRQELGVKASFAEHGDLVVHPNSLHATMPKRSIRSMDLSVKPPDLPVNRQQQVFMPSPGDFGFKQFDRRHAVNHAPPSLSTDVGMDPPGDAHASVVLRPGEDGHQDEGGAGVEASRTSTHGICGGAHHARAHLDGGFAPGAALGINTGQGPDPSAAEDDLHDGTSAMPTSRGAWKKVWQQAWEVPGVHHLRKCMAWFGLSGPDQERAGDDLQDLRGTARQARRKGDEGSYATSGARSQGFFTRLLLLLVFIASHVYGSSLWNYDDGTFEKHFIPSSAPRFDDETYGNTRGDGGGARYGECRHPERRGHVKFEKTSNLKPLKSGQQKRMRGMAHDALVNSKLQRKLVQRKLETGSWPRKHFKFDLVEIFGGSSMVTARGATLWSMRCLQPIDICFGIDLRKRANRRWLLAWLRRVDPRLAMVEYPCTPWTILQKNVNYKDRPEELQARQERDRPFLKLTEQIFESQTSRKGHAIAENPATAQSQQEPEILRLRSKWFETTSCLCMFGMTGKSGLPMQKRVRFIATHPYFIEELNVQCDRMHVHEKVEGQNTAASARYPPLLADAICRAYWRIVEAEDYGTHVYHTETGHNTAWYVDVNRQESEWRPILEAAQEVLARKVQNSIFVSQDSELFGQIAKLVPWQIMNIQLAHLPKAKRTRQGLEDCHRASILLQNDNTVLVETEYLKTAQAPRERFITPVRVGIFVIGYAPGDPAEPTPQREGEDQYIEEPLALMDTDGDKSLVKQTYAKEQWFVGPPLNQKQKKLAPFVAKLHKNLGHPSQPDFTRALVQDGNIEPEVIELSRRLKCATCERSKRPQVPRPTSFKIIGAFNSKLCMDFVHLADANNDNYQFLHILEPNGSFNVFYPCPSREPEQVWDLFTLLWASWAGYPAKLWIDQDGAFAGEFLERMRAAGTQVDHPPAEAHWQTGQVEAYNRAFQEVGRKVIDEWSLMGDRDMKTMACSVAASMNDRIRSAGCSAYQWVFGKNPQMPDDVLSPDGKFEALQAMELDDELRKRARVRATADEKLAAYRLNEAVRTAILRKSHPVKEIYEPGEIVAFWREAKYRQGKKGHKGKRIPASWYRGTVIGPYKGDSDVRQNNYWVTSNGRCILVAREQMRPAFGTELWPVHEHTLQELQDNPPDQYLDLRAEGDPPEEPVDIVPLFQSEDEQDMDIPRDQEVEDVVYTPTTPADSEPPAQEAQVIQDSPPQSIGSDHTTLSPNAPTTPAGEARQQTRMPGTPVAQLWPQPDPKRARIEEMPDLDLEPLATPEMNQPETHPPTAGAESQSHGVLLTLSQTAKDFWECDRKRGLLVRHHLRPRRALYDPSRAHDLPVPLSAVKPGRTTVVRFGSRRKTMKDSWHPPNSNVNLDKTWTGHSIFRVEECHEVLQVQDGWQNPQTMSRKDKKALEKELPWSAIPEEHKEIYKQALAKEWSTWMKYEAVKVLDLECSRHVEQTVDPARILAARVCYRDKHAATPWLEMKPKARIVCRGDNDPDLLELRRDAPTLTRLGMMLLLQVAASIKDSFIVCADITGAFLQGDQALAKRKEPLFIRQPREGLPGLAAGQLLLVVRGIFGLANSPRLFWRFLRDNLIKLGFVQSTLDKALFMYYANIGSEEKPMRRLVVALGAHVDDLICVGMPPYADPILQKVKNEFDFGAWDDSRDNNELTYGGKTITKNPDGSVSLSQSSFIRALTLSPVPKWRTMMKDLQLTAAEVTELKSGGGCLHWLTGQTRPDLAAGTSLNMGGQPTIQNLIEINKLLKEAMRSQDWKMNFVPIDLEEARVVAFSDASWANAEDLKSQAGYMVFITGKNVFTLEGDKASLVEWKSHRIRRRCRSTLAAETMALDAAADAALFTRELLAEIVIESYQPTQSGRLDSEIFPASMATDCRSLYDLLVKDGPLSSTQEKRLTLDIGALREAAEELEPSGENMKEVYKWVPTDIQMADHLTKVKPHHELRDLLSRNHLALLAEEKIKAAHLVCRSSPRYFSLASSRLAQLFKI